MNKIWHVYIGNKSEGPFSFEDLQKDFRLTPDTYVWQIGFADWKKIRDVPELKLLFQEQVKEEPEEDLLNGINKGKIKNEIVLEMNQQPSFFIWILIALIIIFYTLSHLYFND